MQFAFVITSIIAGQNVVAFAILKLLWIFWGPHFYLSDDVYTYSGGLLFSCSAVGVLFYAGVRLMSLGNVFPWAIVSIFVISIEFFYFHNHSHDLWQDLLVFSLLGLLISAAILAVLFAKLLAPNVASRG